MAIGRSSDGCGTRAGDDCGIDKTFVGGKGKFGDGKTRGIDKISGTGGCVA